MKLPTTLLLLAALVLAACAGNASQTAQSKPTEAATPAPTISPTTAPSTVPTTVPTTAPTSRPTAEPAAAEALPEESPTEEPTPDVLDELASELEELGVEKQAIACIRTGLEAQKVDQSALQSAELEVVILLDAMAAVCDVDLVQYLVG